MEALLCPGDNLGLVIRGGAEYGVGIFVIQVDPHSVAERLGLQVCLKEPYDKKMKFDI